MSVTNIQASVQMDGQSCVYKMNIFIWELGETVPWAHGKMYCRVGRGKLCKHPTVHSKVRVVDALHSVIPTKVHPVTAPKRYKLHLWGLGFLYNDFEFGLLLCLSKPT